MLGKCVRERNIAARCSKTETDRQRASQQACEARRKQRKEGKEGKGKGKETERKGSGKERNKERERQRKGGREGGREGERKEERWAGFSRVLGADCWTSILKSTTLLLFGVIWSI